MTLVQKPAVQVSIPSTAESVNWPSEVCAAIERRHLNRVEETPESAQSLLQSVGPFIEGEDKTISIDIENNLFEAFIEDDYEGMLHLKSLKTESNDVVGIVFWREVPVSEMKQWVNWDALSVSISNMREKIRDEEVIEEVDDKISNDLEGKQSSRRASSLIPVRENGLRWLYQATSSSRNLTHNSTQIKNKAVLGEEVKEELMHAWIKIELLAVRKQYWGHRYGSLLLAVTLYEAWLQHNERAILHVAGGYFNIPAVRLYTRFGFVGIKAGENGDGVFQKPNRDLFVLGNIGNALQSLSWSDVLSLPSDKHHAITTGEA